MYTSRATLSAVMLLAGAGAQADVSVQEQMNLEVAIIKAHGTTTRRVTSDKQRTETEFSCEGFMSMLCGHNGSLEIIRLDRAVIMSADPGKKSYVEKPLPTPEERRALEERMQAVAEKLKSCPAPAHGPAPAGVDTSKCQMSPPVVNVTKADDVANIAGHDTHHTIVAMTQSCTNPDTKDSCDMAYTFDVWTANEDLPGMADRRSFQQNYMRKLGLDDAAAAGPPAQLSQFLAPYRDALRKLGDQSGELKGYPLKTSFKVAIGGPHCAAAAKAQGDAAAGASTGDTASNVGSLIGGSAGAAASKLLGGLFGKKKPAEAPAAKPADAAGTASTTGTTSAGSTSGAGGAAGAPAASAPAMTTIAQFSVVTTSIGTEAIPADQFEMPTDWKKLPPKEQAPPEMPSCPKTGN